jgi:hypothetical protein
MVLRITGKVEGADKLQRALAALSGPQLNQAISEGINMGAGRAKNTMRTEMQSVFDRPTPYILNAVQVFKKATPDSLEAVITPTYMGGKGVDPQKILAAQEEGGRRSDKRSEVALRRAGILPSGYQTAIPKTPYPGSDDGRGNLRGAFLVQLISYFQAFGEQGYRANMSAKGYQRVHRGTKKQTGRRYFVSYGAMRGGARMTANNEPDARSQHFAAGIWAVTGTGGADVRPVVMFVKTPKYTPRISLEQIRQRSGVDELVPKWIRGRIYEAAKKAGL